jgi:hypothetical protein
MRKACLCEAAGADPQVPEAITSKGSQILFGGRRIHSPERPASVLEEEHEGITDLALWGILGRQLVD